MAAATVPGQGRGPVNCFTVTGLTCGSQSQDSTVGFDVRRQPAQRQGGPVVPPDSEVGIRAGAGGGRAQALGRPGSGPKQQVLRCEGSEGLPYSNVQSKFFP